MMNNELTDVTHWNGVWSSKPSMRLPTGFDIGTRNILNLLGLYIKREMRYIEIGCAPGKILSWAGHRTGILVSGIDYSESGVAISQWLCEGLRIPHDIRKEDALETTFPPNSFDLVFSCGLIEHFNDPSQIIEAHVKLLAPGGVAIIAIPNYSGIYKICQRYFFPQNLSIHNLEIMSEKELLKLAPKCSGYTSTSFSYGRFSPGLISFSNKYGKLGWGIAFGLNLVSHFQPFIVKSIAPLLVLEIKRN
jgi:2-polyprenyl-3-methyl-5-hydroxy-6-metoxy-1,4-benzoquinol methylase